MNRYVVRFYKYSPFYGLPQIDNELELDFTDEEREMSKIVVGAMLKPDIVEVHVTLMPDGKFLFPVKQVVYNRDEQQPSRWEMFYDSDDRWPELNILGMNVTDIYEQW